MSEISHWPFYPVALTNCSVNFGRLTKTIPISTMMMTQQKIWIGLLCWQWKMEEVEHIFTKSRWWGKANNCDCRTHPSNVNKKYNRDDMHGIFFLMFIHMGNNLCDIQIYMNHKIIRNDVVKRSRRTILCLRLNMDCCLIWPWASPCMIDSFLCYGNFSLASGPWFMIS